MKQASFYEVNDKDGGAIWGGENAHDAIKFARLYEGARIFVSVWDTEKEDFALITDKIDVTPLVMATILNEKERK